MTTPWRVALGAVLGGLLAVAGWRILAHGVADARVGEDPAGALHWVSGHPEALRTLAEQQFDAGQRRAAAETAGELLGREPLEGTAWRVLGQVAQAQADPPRAAQAYAKAIELTPRDASARIWLAEQAVAAEDFTGAIDQLDLLLRTHLTAWGTIFDYMAAQAAHPGFRAALVARLAAGPDGRRRVLEHLQHLNPQTGLAPVADAIHGSLQVQGALPRRDFERWIESLLRRGDWPKAYALWSSFLPQGARLTPVYNGDFILRPSGTGFDWRTPATPGVTVEFPSGQGARISFRNRRIDHAGLEQLLLLPPGRYLLQVEMRPDGLRSDRGLQWTLACAGSGQEVASTPPLGARGNESTAFEMPVQVPEECGAQWLRLRNAARVPALQSLSGAVTVTRVAIAPDRSPPPASGEAEVAGIAPGVVN